jgi:hypothetical protein
VAIIKYFFELNFSSFFIPSKQLNFEKHNANVNNADASKNIDEENIPINIFVIDQKILNANAIFVFIRSLLSLSKLL